MGGHILVIDQGTTSTRAVVFDENARAVASAQEEFRQIYPHPGWIEHDPEDLWRTTLATARKAIADIGGPKSLAGVGIANQRETTLVWDRKTGKPIYNAIVWQDRRTADVCAALARAGHSEVLRERAGLVLDPYFSATKIAWILDHVEGARARAERGELAFGTVDTFLLWRLTGGAVHATDATNAARTCLLNLRSGWDDELIAMFGAPRSLLPDVRDTAGDFGRTQEEHFGAALPVLAMAGDQQSALVGQVCLSPGMAKATYGTGGFILLNTGAAPVRSRHGLLTTIAYQFDGVRAYALEGSIFSAGATVQWLRDGLGIIASAAESGALAAEADPEQEVHLVPAFAGLGAPHWRADARGALVGLTRGATRKEIARAALESVGFQTDDLMAAMAEDFAAGGGTRDKSVVRVDGGMVESDWTMQFLADILGAPVDRPTYKETTALGAAFLAGWRAGFYPSPEAFAECWKLDRRFAPDMDEPTRAAAARGLARGGGLDAASRARAVKVVFRCDPALRDRLPRPLPALQALPDWLRDMPSEAASSLHGREVRTVKQCPPFVDAMRHGFVMRLPCDIRISGGKFSWDWSLPALAADTQPRAPLSFHVAEQVAGSPLDHGGGRSLIKFNSLWTVELEPGYSLFATHPINRPDLPFRTLTGMVDSDRFHAVGILFPATWTEARYEGVLKAGTPIAQCFPVSREPLSLSFEDMSPEQIAAYDDVANTLNAQPGVYRKAYRDKRPSSDR